MEDKNSSLFHQNSSAYQIVSVLRDSNFLLSTSATCICLVALTYDRYVFIQEPLYYPIIMTTKKVSLISMGVWIISLLSIAPLFWPNPDDVQAKLDGVTICERSIG